MLLFTLESIITQDNLKKKCHLIMSQRLVHPVPIVQPLIPQMHEAVTKDVVHYIKSCSAQPGRAHRWTPWMQRGKTHLGTAALRGPPKTNSVSTLPSNFPHSWPGGHISHLRAQLRFLQKDSAPQESGCTNATLTSTPRFEFRCHSQGSMDFSLAALSLSEPGCQVQLLTASIL